MPEYKNGQFYDDDGNPLLATDPHPYVQNKNVVIGEVCVICGLPKHMCLLTYRPLPTEDPLANHPTQIRSANGACEHFVGLRQWGMYPEPWRTCQNCGWPKAQHNLPSCRGVLSLNGEQFGCDLRHPHQGLACRNKSAGAIWSSNAQIIECSGLGV